MPTHTDDQLLWVRYCPQSMLVQTTSLSVTAELAHRRLTDYAWTGNPWLVPTSDAFLAVTRIPRGDLEGVLAELKTVGWRIRNRTLASTEVSLALTTSRSLRDAGRVRARAAAKRRWKETPENIGEKPQKPPMLKQCSSNAQASHKTCSSNAQACDATCTDRPTDRQTDRPTDRPTDSSPVGALNGEPVTVNQPVAAASPLSGSTPLQEGETPNPKAAEERLFLADLLTSLRRFDPKLASAELTNWGGWWRNAFRSNPAKTRRVLAELSSMIAEHRVHTNPGAAAADLWKRLPD